MPQASLFRDSKGNLPPSCPTAGLSPRNSEIRALCPQGPHTPVHIPIRVSPSLRYKMDLLLLWPWPLESERPQCGMRPGCSRKEGGRGDGRPSSCLELPLTLCMLIGMTISLGLSFLTYTLVPPVSLSLLWNRQLYSPTPQPEVTFCLFLSHTTSAHTPNAVRNAYGIDP